MKKTFYSILAVATVFLASCGGAEDAKAEEGKETKEKTEKEAEKPAGVSGTFSAAEGATITWKAKHNKDADWAHVGTMPVSGSVNVTDGAIASGEFTLAVSMLDEGDGEYNEMLENHIQDSTFFNTAVFPTATFTLASVTDAQATGTLSLLGMSQEITFDATTSVTAEGVSVKGTAAIDLASFGMPAIVGSLELPEEEKGEAPSKDIEIDLDLNLAPAAM